VRWGKFKIGELFNIVTGGDLIIGKTRGGEFPLVSHQHKNNGISKRIEHLKNRTLLNAEETIALADRGVFLATCQSENFYIGTRVKALIFKDGKKSNSERLFVVSSINKLQPMFDEYANNATDKLPELEIQLPKSNDGNPDYLYMNEYISQIKNGYIATLESDRNLFVNAHLAVSKIENYALSREDNKILSLELEWGEFRVEDLFDTIKRGKRIKSLDRVHGDLPFITAGTNERGFSSFIGNSETEVFPKNSLTIDMFGNVFYRNYEYGADDHVAVLFNKSFEYDKQTLIFIGACIEKSIVGKYSYSRNFYASDAYELVIHLPKTDKNEPDLAYMSKYIETQQKLVVKSKASGLDLEILATKYVVSLQDR
jgi:hypothetical protein